MAYLNNKSIIYLFIERIEFCLRGWQTWDGAGPAAGGMTWTPSATSPCRACHLQVVYPSTSPSCAGAAWCRHRGWFSTSRASVPLWNSRPTIKKHYTQNTKEFFLLKCVFLYSTLSSPLDHTKRFTLHPWQTCSFRHQLGFSVKHSNHASVITARRLFTHISNHCL